jgi:lambda repressor-like predicted transcriptional regulator
MNYQILDAVLKSKKISIKEFAYQCKISDETLRLALKGRFTKRTRVKIIDGLIKSEICELEIYSILRPGL